MSNPSLQTRIWLRFADNPYRSQTVRNVRYGCLRAARGLLCVLGPLVVRWCKSRRHFKQPSGPSDLLWNEQIFDISIVGHSDPTHSPTDHNGVRRHEKRCLWPVDSVSEYFCNIRGCFLPFIHRLGLLIGPWYVSSCCGYQWQIADVMMFPSSANITCHAVSRLQHACEQWKYRERENLAVFVPNFTPKQLKHSNSKIIFRKFNIICAIVSKIPKIPTPSRIRYSR